MNTWHIWVCACHGQFWADKPRHVTCAACGRLIREQQVITISDALSYSPETIKEVRSYVAS